MHSIRFGGHIDAFDLVYQDDGEINLDKTIEQSGQRATVEELIVSAVSPKNTWAISMNIYWVFLYFSNKQIIGCHYREDG